MAGLPGTGKTTLARELAARLDGVVLSKDEVRAALFPASLVDYTTRQDDLCMQAVLRAAQYLAIHHPTRFVFLDGRTFSRAYQIDDVIAAADECHANWKILHLSCPDQVARMRLEQGSSPNHLARNRDFSLYLDVKSRFELIAQPKLDVDTSQTINDLLPPCEDFLKT